MSIETGTSRHSRSWAFFFLYAVRRVAPLALIVYMGYRFEAWRDPVVIPLLLIWAVSILSFRAAVRHSMRQSRRSMVHTPSLKPAQEVSRAA
jgi:membrane glycosyltransferase